MTATLQTAARWLAEGHKIALGTVTATWGSAPRPAGSQIVVRQDGVFDGSAGRLAAHLVEGGQLSDAELAELRKLIDSNRSPRKATKKSD